jgi:hypothetical protein
MLSVFCCYSGSGILIYGMLTLLIDSSYDIFCFGVGMLNVNFGFYRFTD